VTEYTGGATPDGRINRREAASFIGISPKTLANWALRGLGPKSVKIGGRRFYYVNDIASFVNGANR
jgi:hypothetical protein